MATEADIEAALMRHPYIETIKATSDGATTDVYVRKAGDADEIIRRLGAGQRFKVGGARQWVARIPFERKEK